MTDNMSVLNIKQEIQDTSAAAANCSVSLNVCFSPSTTTSTITSTELSTENPSNRLSAARAGVGIKASPSASPERQMCSSTTNTTLNNNNTEYLNAEEGSTLSSISGNGGVSQINNNNSSIRDELRRLCLVCGDVASGFHYGVASCEACKAFFKRTIQGNIEYTCPANNECEINKRRRKACQACRFQKCLLMGMLKEGVRLDRVRGGRQKYRRNPVSNSYQTMQMLYQSSITLNDIKILEVLSNYEPDMLSLQYHRQQQQQQQQQTRLNNNNISTPSPKNNEEVEEILLNSTCNSPNIKQEQCNYNSMNCSNSSGTTTEVIDATPPSTPTSSTIMGGSGSSNTSSNNYLFKSNNNNIESYDILYALSDLYDKELVFIIGWAKQLPGFTDLPLNDQMKLLQISWAEILTLQLLYRSLPFSGKLYFATDVWMDEQLAKECGYTEFYYHCVLVAQRLERIAPRREEYFLLKALILANCDILLDDQSALRRFRDSILNSLNDVVCLLHHSSAVTHQQQLMLLLPSLRQADVILRRFWRCVHNDGSTPIKKLFIEMLETVGR
uniref:Estrogen-related receptor n=1 Tax=Glossina morsitans morsitans TaxID=37546 RepID=A0A1B0FKQ8_GLOMM